MRSLGSLSRALNYWTGGERGQTLLGFFVGFDAFTQAV